MNLNPFSWFRKKNPRLIIEILPDYTAICSWELPADKNDNAIFNSADKCANLIIALSTGKLDTTLRNDLSISAYKQSQVMTAKVALSLLEEASESPKKKKKGPLISPDKTFEGGN